MNYELYGGERNSKNGRLSQSHYLLVSDKEVYYRVASYCPPLVDTINIPDGTAVWEASLLYAPVEVFTGLRNVQSLNPETSKCKNG